MSQRSSILNAIEEELKLLGENSEAMDKAEGSGVQSREVHAEPKPSASEKKKGFKLTGGGQTVGGDSGGVTEGVVSEEEGAICKADGKGVASRDPKDISGRDASGAPSAGGAEEGGGSLAVDKAKGSTVASPKAKKSDGTSGGGGSNAKAVEKAKGKGVASPSTKEDGLDNEGVKENVIELPHDVMVEDSEGNIQTLKKGTKVVIGEMGMAMDYAEGEAGPGYEAGMDYEDESMGYEDEVVEPEECPIADAAVDAGADEALVTRIVTAVVQALNGGGDYDYAMEGKEIQVKALLEDTKKILENKPWEKKEEQGEEGEEKSYGHKGKSKSYGEMGEEEVEECAEDTKKKGTQVTEDHDEDGEFGGGDEDGGVDSLDGEEMEVDESSPEYIAALIDDVEDDLENLKGALGVGGEEEGEEEIMDYEGEEEEEIGGEEEEEEEADISSLF